MDTREIVECGGSWEVWDYWGNRLFEAGSYGECVDWLGDTDPDEEDSLF